MTGGLPSARGEWRFTQVTLFVAAWLLVAPGLQDRWLVQLLLQACLLNAVWMTLKVNPEWTGLRHLTIGFWVLAVAGSTLALAPLPAGMLRLAQQLEAVSALPLFALLAAGILRFVYRSRRLTVDGILATVVVYLLVAIAFAELYVLLIGANPSSFALPVPAAERSPNLLQVDMIYYSLITQCSVGYGDILPRSDLARMVAVIQAVLGQFYMAVVVAVFVGMFASQRRA